MKHHVKFTSERLLTTIVEVLERDDIFRLTVSLNFDHYKFEVREAHFHPKSFGANPVITACKSGQLYAFIYQTSQRQHTIIRNATKGQKQVTNIQHNVLTSLTHLVQLHNTVS